VKAVKDFLEIFVFRFYSGWMGHPLFFRFTKPYEIYQKTLDVLHDFCQKIVEKRKAEYARKGKVPNFPQILNQRQLSLPLTDDRGW